MGAITINVTDPTRAKFYIAGISFIGVMFVLSAIICITAFYQLCCRNHELVSKLYRNLTLICILSLTISVIGDLIHLIIRWMDFPNATYYTPDELLLITINDAIYFIGNITFYILLLLRIYNAFKSNRIMTAFMSFVIIICILASVSYLVIIFYYNSEYFKGPDGIIQYLTHLKYAVYPLSISTAVLDIGFFVVFFHQMRRIVVDIDIQSAMYLNIYNVLTKQVVLFLPAVISNQLFFAYLFYVTYVLPHLAVEEYVPYLVVAYMVRTFEVVINILVLWLIININHDKYIRVCKYYHICCARCLSKHNDKPLANPYQRMTTFS